MAEYAEACLKQASIPVIVKDGKRDYDHVKKINNWIRFDCDVEGEKETISSILQTQGIAHICIPSTNYHPKHKPYKYHIHVPTKKVAQDVVKYKWQMREAMSDLGINLHDKRVTEICVQNCNPYDNGKNPKRGQKYVEVFDGEPYKLKKAPKTLEWSPMAKTVFNGRGGEEVINKQVVKATENLEVLSPESGIKIGSVGWVRIKDLNLEPGGIIGNLSCPGHNHNHQGGAHKAGYAFATMNEGGDVWLTCSGAECNGRSYKMDQEDFGAFTKLSDLFEIRRLVNLCAYDFSNGSFILVKDDRVVNFRERELIKYFGDDLFFKLPLKPNDEEADTIAELKAVLADAAEFESKVDASVAIGDRESWSLDEVGEWNKKKLAAQAELDAWPGKIEERVIRDALGSEKNYNYFRATYTDLDAYKLTVIKNVTEHIKMKRQFNALDYRIDPFIEEVRGEINNEGVLTIILNDVVGEKLTGTPNEKFVNDYKKHNPYLVDMLEMIMAQRFGADQKTSYLWLHAESDWGKSFLFDGVLGSVNFNVSVDEIKMADKGAPSGLNPVKAAKSLFMFVDEFGGAVKELKKITNKLNITPKGKRQTTVPIFMKIFASAEQVKSLQGEGGAVEAQFRNRFLKIRATGSLLERKLYAENKNEYFKAIKLYVNHTMIKIQERYMALGRDAAADEADKVYQGLISKYTIKQNSVDLEESLEAEFAEWIDDVARRERVDLAIGGVWYENEIFFKGGNVYFRHVTKVVDLFIADAVPDSQKGMVRHKTSEAVIGRQNLKRAGFSYRGTKFNARKYKRATSKKTAY